MEVSVHLDVPVSLSPGKQLALLFGHKDGKTPDQGRIKLFGAPRQ